MDNKELVEATYKARGLSYQRRYPNEQFGAFLAGTFFRVPPERRAGVQILELGCGTGANLWVVAREGFAAFGIDFSPTAIELCRQVLGTWRVEFEAYAAVLKTLAEPHPARFLEGKMIQPVFRVR